MRDRNLVPQFISLFMESGFNKTEISGQTARINCALETKVPTGLRISSKSLFSELRSCFLY